MGIKTMFQVARAAMSGRSEEAPGVVWTNPTTGESIAGGVSRTPYAAAFTRPNNTDAYAIGDLIANHGTAANVVPMTFAIAREAGGSGAIIKARIRKSGNTIANAAMRLHLFAAANAAALTVQNGDNGVFLPNSAAVWLGAMDFLTFQAFYDGAVSNGLPVTGPAILFDLADGQSNIYGLLEARGALVPGALETFTVGLEVLQD